MDVFKSLVHYICDKTSYESSKFGSVKLNKTLWFSDLFAYLNYGEPITDAVYVKRQYGPAPSNILPVLRELEGESKIMVKKIPFYGYTQTFHLSQKKADSTFFGEGRKILVDSVLEQIVKDHTASSISDLSHSEIWEMAEYGEEIPFYTVFSLSPGEVRDSDTTWSRKCS